jgi:hypothetical protein
MTRAEYIVVMHFCHIRCSPEKRNCENCPYLKAYKQIYGDEEYSPKYYSTKEKRYKIFCI